MAILIEYPWIAVLVAAACATLWNWRRRRIALVAAAAWALYAVYEYLMHFRVLCSGECNIRVDLLLMHPVLLVMTLVALIASARPEHGSQLRRGRHADRR